MKKVLCYLGIIILFGLGILPPILRLTLQDKVVDTSLENNKNQILTCSNDYYTVNSRFENNKLNMFVMMKNKNIKISDARDESDDEFLENDEIKEMKELDDLFTYLKTGANVISAETNENENIQIDFSLNEHKDLNLEKINRSLEIQKKFYEGFNLTCTIKDL